MYATNFFGSKIWQYNDTHTWCGDGTYITYTYEYTYPSNTNLGWSYKGDTKSPQYGVGYNVWSENMTGHFCLASYFNCVENSYPTISFEVGGGGQVYYYNLS